MALRSPSSSSSFSYGFTYDVFLSFRGSDTRFDFTGNLYKALSDRGIHAFIDDEELKGGDEITPSLVGAIKESRIAIPVFSKNYAYSSFTLDELVTIIECVKAEGRLLLPVFCGVDPSHVRHQTKSYAKALAKHEERFKHNKEKYTDNMERLRKWKMALTQAANLSGKHFILGKEYEHKFIGKIVKEVSNTIKRVPLHVADYPVGLESRVQEVKSLLDVGSDDGALMVGIYGVGGMGKTTLARAIYNSIADQFEGLCFLDDVRKNSNKHGLVNLQETLLFETIGEKDIRLGSVNKGIQIIKQRLHRKKVLLILDDVNKLEQLRALAGRCDWFGSGSRVIITTQDKRLAASHGIERTHEVDGLERKEALELLRWNAFKSNIVDSSYEDILNRVIAYASGLPLALEVVGSNLYGKPIEEWESMLDMYKRIPNNDIQNILRVSFDALQEEEQSVFLDISCCFKGYQLLEVKDILHAHYAYCVKHHIGVLAEKSLIKISPGDYVTLHDLIESMGKRIVRQESPKEPGKRSRLWFHEDIVQVLEDNTGTSRIEVIHLDSPSFELVEWDGDEFKNMKNLKTIIIKSGRFSNGVGHLPNSLRVLEWHGYPSQNLPYDFFPKKLSMCKLGGSYLTSFELPYSSKGFVNMTVLNLDECKSLTQICDVSSLSNLEELSFMKCRQLTTIHKSIGLLNKLKILNAEECHKLESFPPIKLTSLQRLLLSHCTSLKNFPEILGEMKNITDISLWYTSIQELPSSFEKLTGLRFLAIQGKHRMRLPSSILMMPKLSDLGAVSYALLPKENDKPSFTVSSNVQSLQLLKCNLSGESLPTFLTWFANVRHLDLWGSNFTILPECLNKCHFLTSLKLDYCNYLREIRGIPPNLKLLSAFGCKSLTCSSSIMLLNQELHESGDTAFCLPGTATIPEWFEHQSKGLSISFWFRNKFPSMALFVVRERMLPLCYEFPSLEPDLFINGHHQKYVPDGFGVDYLPYNSGLKPNYTYLFDLQLHNHCYEFDLQLHCHEGVESKPEEAQLKNKWNHAELRYEVKRSGFPALSGNKGKHVMEEEDGEEDEVSYLEIGIHVYEQRNSMEDIQFTNPYE